MKKAKKYKLKTNKSIVKRRLKISKFSTFVKKQIDHNSIS